MRVQVSLLPAVAFCILALAVACFIFLRSCLQLPSCLQGRYTWPACMRALAYTIAY